ncbi:hypothetical protein CPT_Sansa113 [Caulobacter phage Sansa]|uniref:Uncharacterized protein n=1 Tax=Caulobacter phage Sansa TaxID=1675600 RepID=A0A0K1LLX8_9CAUD|nr:hypothetical protein HOR07_gp113 [Caulobacter phage Sansa]AKU43517.1 hypothetical protein CPT_Sansa113 [Caulobacter phage Sansa]
MSQLYDPNAQPVFVAVGNPAAGYAFHGPFPDSIEAADWGNALNLSDSPDGWSICPLIPPILDGKLVYPSAPSWDARDLYSVNGCGARLVHKTPDGYSVMDLLDSDDWRAGMVKEGERFEVLHNGGEILPGGSNTAAKDLGDALDLIASDQEKARELNRFSLDNLGPDKMAVHVREGDKHLVTFYGKDALRRAQRLITHPEYTKHIFG